MLKYTGIFGGVQGLKMLMSIIRTKLASKLLGPAGIGLMGIYVNVSDFLASSTNLGLPMSTVQHLSELQGEQDDAAIARFVRVIRSWSLALAIVAMVLCVALAPLLGSMFSDAENTVGWDLALLAPMVGALLVTGGEVAILKGTRHLKRIALISLLAAVATLVFTVPFFYAWGIAGILAALDVSTIAVLIVHLCFSLPLFRWHVSLTDRDVWRAGWPMVKVGIPYVMAAIAGSGVAMALPALMLRYGTMDDVGYYRVGYMLMVTYASIVFTSLEADFFPRLSSVNHDTQLRNDTINQQIRVNVLLVAPLLIAMIVMIHVMIRVLTSAEFLPVADMAVCSVYYMFLRAITLPLGFVPLACSHSLRYLLMEVVYDAVSLGLIVGCYIEWGLIGAGIGLSLSALFDMIVLSLYYGHCYQLKLQWTTLRLVLPQAVIVGIALWICLLDISPLMRYALGAVCLALSVWLSYGVLSRESTIVAKFKQRLHR